MYTTDAQVLQDLSAALHKVSVAALTAASPWLNNASAISLPHAMAYDIITAALSQRGYTPAQIAAWDSGSLYERVIGTYWCLVENGVLSQASPDFIKKYEQYMTWLNTTSVTVSGVIVEPLGVATQVASGTVTAFQPRRQCRGSNGWFGPGPWPG